MRGVGKTLQKVLSRFLNPRGVSGHYVAGRRPSWWLESIPYRSPYKLGKSNLISLINTHFVERNIFIVFMTVWKACYKKSWSLGDFVGQTSHCISRSL